MPRRLVGLLVILIGLAAPAGCGGDIPLNEALAVTDVLSGYYDNGIKGTGTQYLPIITFKLKNQSVQKVPGIELDVAFWEEGATGRSHPARDADESVAPVRHGARRQRRRRARRRAAFRCPDSVDPAVESGVAPHVVRVSENESR